MGPVLSGECHAMSTVARTSLYSITCILYIYIIYIYKYFLNVNYLFILPLLLFFHYSCWVEVFPEKLLQLEVLRNSIKLRKMSCGHVFTILVLLTFCL